MKKIFSILAAAVIALSFVSCEKEDAGAKFFKLKITATTDSTVTLSVNPADTTVYYGLILYPEYYIKQFTLDTLLAWNFEDIQDDYANGVSLDAMLGKGPYVIEDIPVPANTTFTFGAFEVLENNGELSMGRTAFKIYTTKKIEVVDEVDLGAFENGEAYDYRELMGFYAIDGWDDAETAEVYLCIYEDKNLKGTYNYVDIHPAYSAVWIDGKGVLGIADAKVTCTLKSDTIGKVTGWVVDEEGVKYKFSYGYTIKEPTLVPAPARIAKKEFAEEPKNLLAPKRLRK